MKTLLKSFTCVTALCLCACVSAGCAVESFFTQTFCKHQYDDGTVIIKSTCIESGEKLKTCTLCDKTVSETIAAFGHDIVKDDGYSAGCFSTGLTDGSHCARCNVVFIEQAEIPATGHNNDAIGICADCGVGDADFSVFENSENYTLSDVLPDSSIEFGQVYRMPSDLADFTLYQFNNCFGGVDFLCWEVVVSAWPEGENVVCDLDISVVVDDGDYAGTWSCTSLEVDSTALLWNSTVIDGFIYFVFYPEKEIPLLMSSEDIILENYAFDETTNLNIVYDDAFKIEQVDLVSV